MYDVIRLVENGETLEHVEECEEMGWLRLELEAGKTGGWLCPRERRCTERRS